jgi:tetratricopeptide (TPR) repeat protein
MLADNGQPARNPYLERADRLQPGDYDRKFALAAQRTQEDSKTRVAAFNPLARADKAEVHHALANVEEKLKHPLEAVREYQRAAELNPSEQYLFDWGTDLLAHRAQEAAIEVLAKGNRLFPDSARMLIGMGVGRHALGDVDQALDCLCRASTESRRYHTVPFSPRFRPLRPFNAGRLSGSTVCGNPSRECVCQLLLRCCGKRPGPADDGLPRPAVSLEKALQLDLKLAPAYLLWALFIPIMGRAQGCCRLPASD